MRMPSPFPAAMIALLCASSALAQAPGYEAEIRAFEQFVQEEMKAQKIPALSVAVRKGEFVWARGFGWADIENTVPATADSSYRMASVTKPMTAVAVLKLVEQGKIDLDAEVQKYVPDFPRKPHPVTVRLLLGHLGGISHYRSYAAEGHIKEPKTTKEALALFQDFDLVAEPGTRYSYSSYGYNLLGAVIEGASGKSYAEFLREEVWKPLGMTHTRMDHPREIIPNRVRGYERAGDAVRNSEYVDISSRFAGGGTRSTVSDLIRFMDGMQTGKILRPETVDLMWTGLATRDGTASRYALGWGVTPASGRFMVGHGGSQQETRTSITLAPRERFALALASNLEDADLNVFEFRLAELFLGDNWNAGMYTGAAAGQTALDAMASAFNNGAAYYDRHGRPRSVDRAELDEAFRYFNETLDPKRVAALTGEDTMLSRGRHPSGKEAFIKVGSYVADRLARAGKDMDRYHREGPLSFFADYVALYGTSRDIPARYRFDRSIAEDTRRWSADWNRVFTGELRHLSAASLADSAEMAAMLRARVSGASVKPDYSEGLVGLAEGAAQRGDMARATRIGSLALELYPEAEGPNGFVGVMAVISGDATRGRTLLGKAVARNPLGYASAGNLQDIARFLAREAPLRPAGMALLEMGAELHPRSAPLLVQLGDAAREAGMKDKARAAYERALAIDPTSEAAKKGLAGL